MVCPHYKDNSLHKPPSRGRAKVLLCCRCTTEATLVIREGSKRWMEIRAVITSDWGVFIQPSKYEWKIILNIYIYFGFMTKLCTTLVFQIIIIILILLYQFAKPNYFIHLSFKLIIIGNNLMIIMWKEINKIYWWKWYLERKNHYSSLDLDRTTMYVTINSVKSIQFEIRRI